MFRVFCPGDYRAPAHRLMIMNNGTVREVKHFTTLTSIRENFSFSKNIKYKDICKSQEKMVIVYWPSDGFMFDTDTG